MSGYRVDASGMTYMGARYYDPAGGRFISPDPLGHEECPDLYSYANGDPVNFLDPTGRAYRSRVNDNVPEFWNYKSKAWSSEMSSEQRNIAFGQNTNGEWRTKSTYEIQQDYRERLSTHLEHDLEYASTTGVETLKWTTNLSIGAYVAAEYLGSQAFANVVGRGKTLWDAMKAESALQFANHTGQGLLLGSTSNSTIGNVFLGSRLTSSSVAAANAAISEGAFTALQTAEAWSLANTGASLSTWGGGFITGAESYVAFNSGSIEPPADGVITHPFDIVPAIAGGVGQLWNTSTNSPNSNSVGDPTGKWIKN